MAVAFTKEPVWVLEQILLRLKSLLTNRFQRTKTTCVSGWALANYLHSIVQITRKWLEYCLTFWKGMLTGAEVAHKMMLSKQWKIVSFMHPSWLCQTLKGHLVISVTLLAVLFVADKHWRLWACDCFWLSPAESGWEKLPSSWQRVTRYEVCSSRIQGTSVRLQAFHSLYRSCLLTHCDQVASPLTVDGLLAVILCEYNFEVKHKPGK